MTKTVLQMQSLAIQFRDQLEGQAIALEPGTFVVMPAHAPDALNATEHLAFLLILSEQSQPRRSQEGVAQ